MIQKCETIEKNNFFSIIETEFSKKTNRIITKKFLKEKSRKNAIIFSKECKIT